MKEAAILSIPLILSFHSLKIKKKNASDKTENNFTKELFQLFLHALHAACLQKIKKEAHWMKSKRVARRNEKWNDMQKIHPHHATLVLIINYKSAFYFNSRKFRCYWHLWKSKCRHLEIIIIILNWVSYLSRPCGCVSSRIAAVKIQFEISVANFVRKRRKRKSIILTERSNDDVEQLARRKMGRLNNYIHCFHVGIKFCLSRLE